MNLNDLIEDATGDKPKPPKQFNDGQGGAGSSFGNSARGRMTITLAEMALEALHKKGGVKYLMRVAEADPKAFLSLLGKIPMQKDDTGAGELAQTLMEHMANAARIQTDQAREQEVQRARRARVVSEQ